MQYTSNYNLKKPEGTDIVNIDDLNDNADILDQKLKEVENKADNAPPNSVNDAAIGSRTPDQSQAPASPGTGTLTQLISWLANRIKAITGKTNWWDAPPTTLQAAKTHMDAAAPHSGHETPAGAQAKAEAALAAAEQYTDQEVGEVAQALTTHLAENATTSAKGHVQLSDSVTSTSTTLAATANAVKKAYDRANEAFQSASDGKNLIATAIAGLGLDADGSDTFSELAGIIEGIPKQGAQTIIPGTSDKTIASGRYLTGTQTIKGDANLIPANIAEDKSIFGVQGTLKRVAYNIISIGGRLYFTSMDNKKINELDPDTLAVLKSVTSPTSDAIGIGGILNRLYYCGTSPKLYELNPNILAVLKTVDAPGSTLQGIGGISNRLYHCDTSVSVGKLYELNPNDLTTINTKNANAAYPSGIGGISNRLYQSNVNKREIYELNVDTLAVVKTSGNKDDGPGGIGGISNRLYYSTLYSKEIKEINPNTLSVLKTVSADTRGFGIGGLKKTVVILEINTILDVNEPDIIKYSNNNYYK